MGIVKSHFYDKFSENQILVGYFKVATLNRSDITKSIKKNAMTNSHQLPLYKLNTTSFLIHTPYHSMHRLTY